MSHRIIDRDVEFYFSMVDHHISQRRACAPEDEARFAILRDAALTVAHALDAYRSLLNKDTNHGS